MSSRAQIIISLGVGILFFLSAITLLKYGHFHEDAYILFQYSKNFSNGQGITFDRVSGPAEGATDFLWMIGLGALSSLGIDFGVGAALLNSIGLATICYVTIKLRGAIDQFSVSAILLVVFSGGLSAALGGFSTLAYGGLFSVFVLCAIERRLKLVSLLALLLPLFRPDGALLVIGTLFVLFYGSDKEGRYALIKYLSLTVVFGLGYFIWRYNYFQLILPLPLLVKSKTDKLLEGLSGNLLAVNPYLFLLLPLVISCVRPGLKFVDWKRVFIVFSGPLILFAALSFAHQTQNVGNRFQFPIILSIIFVYLISLRAFRKVSNFFLILPVAGIFLGLGMIKGDVTYLTSKDYYINSFPQHLRSNHFVVNKIALTEAGRFPFWFDADEMVDLIGLNSAMVVKNGPNAALEATSPDLIFVHHAGRYDTSSFDQNSIFVVTDANNLRLKSKYTGNDATLLAPEIALQYAIKHNYQAVLVKYDENDQDFFHIYFLSSGIDRSKFIQSLEFTITNYITYNESLILAKKYLKIPS